MPELPEVETTRAGLSPHILGCRVELLQVWQPSLRWPVPQEMASFFEGKRILELRRRGKYLILSTETGSALIHLGMSGSMRICQSQEPLRKHDHWEIRFENGSLLRYHDPRRFGAFLWAGAEPDKHKLLASLGPEPTEEEFTAEYIFGRSRGRAQPIKSFLMDSHTVVGVGNIYASESLFRSGIHPNRAAGKVSLKRYKVLVEAVKKVLDEAIASGGSTLRDYVNGSGSPGYFQQKLLVYGRSAEPCINCSTPIRQLRIGQRSSFYCTRCQN
jgi:formamidopyrimidine-DNA glycosylase